MTICRFKRIAVFLSSLFVMCFVVLADTATAQGLALAPEGPWLTDENKMILLVAVRLVMVVGVVIAGMVALVSGFHWMYSEGNAKKAFDNKYRLAKALGVITALFFLMVIYKAFVPDYSILSI